MNDNKTEIIKLWQYRKDHIFLLSHDDRDLKTYIKDYSLKTMLIILLITVVASAIFGVVFGLLAGDISRSIIGWFAFFVISYLYTRIYGYFLFLNYVESSEIVGPFAAVLIAAVIGNYFSSIKIGIITFLICVYISLKIEKSINYEKQNSLEDIIKNIDDEKENHSTETKET